MDKEGKRINRQGDLGVIYELLMEEEVVTKRMAAHALGYPLDKHSDRYIRDLMAKIGRIKPLISLSSERGYRLAKNKNDLGKAKEAYYTLLKHCRQVYARSRWLKAFIDKYEKLEHYMTFGEIGLSDIVEEEEE